MQIAQNKVQCRGVLVKVVNFLFTYKPRNFDQLRKYRFATKGMKFVTWLEEKENIDRTYYKHGRSWNCKE